MLRYEILERADDVVTVRIEGEMIGNGVSRQLRDFLEVHYVDDGVSRIRLDLAGVTELDEEGMGALIDLRARSISQHKQLNVANAEGQVRSKLRVAGLLSKLEEGR